MIVLLVLLASCTPTDSVHYDDVLKLQKDNNTTDSITIVGQVIYPPIDDDYGLMVIKDQPLTNIYFFIDNPELSVKKNDIISFSGQYVTTYLDEEDEYAIDTPVLKFSEFKSLGTSDIKFDDAGFKLVRVDLQHQQQDPEVFFTFEGNETFIDEVTNQTIICSLFSMVNVSDEEQNAFMGSAFITDLVKPDIKLPEVYSMSEPRLKDYDTVYRLEPHQEAKSSSCFIYPGSEHFVDIRFGNGEAFKYYFTLPMGLEPEVQN